MRVFRLKNSVRTVSGMMITLCLCLMPFFAAADMVVNVLAVNGSDVAQNKEIQFSLPGEIKPADIIDTNGLQLEYDVKDAGYYLHGKFLLQPKESRTFRVKLRDIWRISDDEAAALRKEIEQSHQDMGAERSPENGQILKDKLLAQLDYVLKDQSQSFETIEQRIDNYRSHVQTLTDIRNKAHFIDYWRSDATEEESNKVINYVLEVSNPSDKTKKVKQKHFVPEEVRPEYIIDRQGYEIRYDEKKKAIFLFKEEDLAPRVTKNVKVGIRDVWHVKQKDMAFIRTRAQDMFESLKTSKFLATAQSLMNDITNNLALIDSLQAMEQPDIKQHIGAFRINQKRYEQARADLDSLEKLLARHRMELEKSKVKNVLQKMKQLNSLARVSQAIFDKKPTVNAAWKLIGGVMIFLAIFTVIHFGTWFFRTAREKKQQDISLPKEIKKEES